MKLGIIKQRVQVVLLRAVLASLRPGLYRFLSAI
jgi:hypothetical protein